MMLWAFFDESGKLAESDFMCLCGYVSGEGQPGSSWDKFTEEWRAVLMREGLPYIHTSQLFARRPPYDLIGWNGSKINDVLSSLSRCVSRHVVAGFGVALDAKHYRSLAKERRNLIGDKTPEIFLFHRLLRLVVKALETLNYPNPISLTFDWSDGFSDGCLKPLTALIKRHEDIRNRISSIGFANDEQYYPLQAADMLCFGTKQKLQGVEEPFYKILTEGEPGLPPIHYSSEYWDAAAIDQLWGERRGGLPSSDPAPAIPLRANL